MSIRGISESIMSPLGHLYCRYSIIKKESDVKCSLCPVLLQSVSAHINKKVKIAYAWW